MSHRPQSVNEPADPCNKLLGRTAELEICRHSQNKKNKKERERERGRRTEGGREKELWTGGLSRRRLSEVFPEPATAPGANFKQIQHPACSDVRHKLPDTTRTKTKRINREIYRVTFYILAGQKRPEWSWRWRWRAVVVSRCQTHACQLTNTLSTISFSGSRKFSRSPIIPPLVPITWTNKSSENEEVFLFILMDRKSFIKSTNLEAYHHHVDPRRAEL